MSFSQERYRDFAILIGQFLKEEFQVGGIVEISASDRDLIAVMRRYFAAQAELESLKAQLEAARQAAGDAIGVFYDPRQNAEHAADLQRSHSLREEMASLMQRAEAWGRAASGADKHDRSAAEAEPEE
ncbi:hypothetical protein GOB36_02375 [Sinorhizobium meliloti]|uniref:hypothetical protein n=1 Tax=Rhizobium meliloti TaxID=382 RepID=UPI000FDA9DF2|nr:hypothetical protein [Sinorhizobium meliloti]MCO6426013.1 hypothetical protein [Sinorhizobium meliloti]MDW9629133.1 hypothetical protein [Sinorhizobium meliloti]MDW9919398.1 hypothetical protein [Sinorhizobium meliloti]MDX0030818.1 hypothetical protein [Sinorhizobium meliloti]MDX0361070.1 hypothetical protein [Sinorhizobium meliloti]